jgi:uncharacterized membrane protein YphA (DoxX/SURF4 family)
MFLDFSRWSDLALLALRIAVAAIFWVHGRSKAGTWKAQPSPQTPAPMLNLMRTLSVAEPLGALAMLTGVLSQFAAIGFMLVMGGAIYMKIRLWKTPFFAHDKTGWELDLLVLAASFALLILGPGAYTLLSLLS